MPNHYTTIAICSPGYDFDAADFNQRHVDSNLCDIVKPMPEPVQETTIGFGLTVDPEGTKTWKDTDGWYGWAIKHWGTKWGAYDIEAFSLGGDSSPVAIKFQSAWNTPSNLADIAQWMKKTYGFEKVDFVGFDPYDDTVKML